VTTTSRNVEHLQTILAEVRDMNRRIGLLVGVACKLPVTVAAPAETTALRVNCNCVNETTLDLLYVVAGKTLNEFRGVDERNLLNVTCFLCA